MKYELISAKRWSKTHVKYPLAANVISLCRWAVNPDKIEPLGRGKLTCSLCLKLLPFTKFAFGDITKEYALKLLGRK
jgi:hypothetical protein